MIDAFHPRFCTGGNLIHLLTEKETPMATQTTPTIKTALTPAFTAPPTETAQAATLPTNPRTNAINYNGKKELLQRYVVIVKDETKKDHKRWQEIIDVRCWTSHNADGSAPLYASIWIHDPKIELSGRGCARGCGYHKPSEAIGEAIADAGITLRYSISGVGNNAVRYALYAIAAAIGYGDVYIVEF